MSQGTGTRFPLAFSRTSKALITGGSVGSYAPLGRTGMMLSRAVSPCALSVVYLSLNTPATGDCVTSQGLNVSTRRICACEQGRPVCGDDAERHPRLRSPTQEVAGGKYPTTWIGWCCCSVHTPYTQYHSPSRAEVMAVDVPLPVAVELNVEGPWKPKSWQGLPGFTE